MKFFNIIALVNLIGLKLFSAQMNFVDYVESVVKNDPTNESKTLKVADLTQDWVNHYEMAVSLGTTTDYTEKTSIAHFNKFLAADCSEINLASCIGDLICSGEIDANFNTKDDFGPIPKFPCN